MGAQCAFATHVASLKMLSDLMWAQECQLDNCTGAQSLEGQSHCVDSALLTISLLALLRFVKSFVVEGFASSC